MRDLAAHRESPGGERRISRRPAPSRPIIPSPRAPALPAELAAFEGLVDPAVLDAAAQRAAALGVGGDEVLRCHRILSPDQITLGLASYLGIAIDSLEADSPPPLAAAQAGVFARDQPGNKIVYKVAPRGFGLRKFCKAIRNEPKAARYFRIAAPERLAEAIRDAAADDVAANAVHGLRRWRPDLSALAYGSGRLRWLAILFSAALASAAIFAPDGLLIAIEYFLAFSFIAWTVLRLTACFVRPKPNADIEIPDRFLPIYTIVLALHREAPVVAKLVAAVQQLRYPLEKLDIKIVLEEDDIETRAEVAKLGLAAPFEVIAPPRAGPQTKPRALATALLFARGSYVTVFDAEDEPEPNQLRLALAAFAANPELACVQAKLFVDNVADGWFSRHFASEYAGQFDVFLPALARFGLPIPLGGTSNHFRIDALRRTGGWDPFNVTEDADLGMRFARFGYRIGVINSTTWEEAPVGFSQWLRQRTRWFKGWMQTWIVHMRHPIRLWRELGWCGFLAFQLLVGGTILSALVHPLFMAIVAWNVWAGELFAWGETAEHSFRKVLAIAVLVIGYAGTAALGLIGLSRRRLLGHAWILPTIPLYWLLLSLAALRALFYLIKEPYHWEKTPHGLARSSLRGGHRQQSKNGADSKQARKAGARRSAGPAMTMLAERAAVRSLNPSSTHRRSDIR